LASNAQSLRGWFLLLSRYKFPAFFLILSFIM
jgi:hypothetical protein